MRRGHSCAIIPVLTLVLTTGAPAQSPHATSAAHGLRSTAGIPDPALGTLRGIAGAPVDGAGTRHREPVVAGLLGVLPGLGHAYAGATPQPPRAATDSASRDE